MWTTDLKRYAAFCRAHEARIPLFYQPWWLDAVCESGRWMPFVFGDRAVWPVYVKQKGPFKKITLPVLTARLAPWQPDPVMKLPNLQPVLQQLPFVLGKVFHVAGESNTFRQFSNMGFAVTEFLHYVIPAKRPLAATEARFSTLSRRNLRSAAGQLSLVNLNNTNTLHALMSRSLERHGEKNPVSSTVLTRLFQALCERQCGAVWSAQNQEQQTVAAAFFAWDATTVYYLAGGMDERIPQSGASRFLLWEGIKFALQSGRSFDFGGGFIEGVDAVYRSMGGIPEPYCVLQQSNFLEKWRRRLTKTK